MIVTHTVNPQGHRRIYLGGKASIECWIEPAADGKAWSFHLESSSSCYPRAEAELRQWAQQVLMKLAAELSVLPPELNTVPFDAIAALHTSDPVDYRRVPMSRRQRAEHGYFNTAPDITQPQSRFSRSGPSRPNKR